MNTIDPASLSGASSFTGSLAPTGSSVMGKDEFLRLLVTQLKNQDPTNPMDGQQFAAQLAQFSSVEQLMNIDQTLAANGQMNGLLAQSVNSGVAAGLIGKSVEADGNSVHWDGKAPSELHFDLGGAANDVTVRIRNAAGQVVREMNLGAYATGEHTITWDGMTAKGGTAGPGTYTFEVTATAGSKGEVNVPARTFRQGTVERVTFGQDGIMLWIGGSPIPMSQIRSVEP